MLMITQQLKKVLCTSRKKKEWIPNIHAQFNEANKMTLKPIKKRKKWENKEIKDKLNLLPYEKRRRWEI